MNGEKREGGGATTTKQVCGATLLRFVCSTPPPEVAKEPSKWDGVAIRHEYVSCSLAPNGRRKPLLMVFIVCHALPDSHSHLFCKNWISFKAWWVKIGLFVLGRGRMVHWGDGHEKPHETLMTFVYHSLATQKMHVRRKLIANDSHTFQQFSHMLPEDPPVACKGCLWNLQEGCTDQRLI